MINLISATRLISRSKCIRRASPELRTGREEVEEGRWGGAVKDGRQEDEKRGDWKKERGEMEQG